MYGMDRRAIVRGFPRAILSLCMSGLWVGVVVRTGLSHLLILLLWYGLSMFDKTLGIQWVFLQFCIEC